MIEDWLLKEEAYEPPKGRDRFIDKSIAGFLRVVALVRLGRSNGPSLPIDPVLQTAASLLLLILLSLTRSWLFLAAVDVLLLALWLRLPYRRGLGILAVSAAVPLLMLIALLPAIWSGSLLPNLLLVAKMASSILLVQLLTAMNRWQELVRAFKVLHLPDLAIWIMDVTLKYIGLLGEYATQLLYALKLRSVGQRVPGKFTAVSGVMGNLFLKSQRMGEEMAEAMECRGFTGDYPKPARRRWGLPDFAYLLLLMVLLGLFLYEYRGT